MSKLKVAVIVGSNRRDSINRRFAEALIRLVGHYVHAHFVRIDDLPMYNQDLEAERPEAVTRFTREIANADALLFVTPEHNRAVAGLAAARAQGRIGGRRKKLDAAERREIAESVISGRKSGAEMARLYNVSAPTVSRIVSAHRADRLAVGR